MSEDPTNAQMTLHCDIGEHDLLGYRLRDATWNGTQLDPQAAISWLFTRSCYASRRVLHRPNGEISRALVFS